MDERISGCCSKISSSRFPRTMWTRPCRTSPGTPLTTHVLLTKTISSGKEKLFPEMPEVCPRMGSKGKLSVPLTMVVLFTVKAVLVLANMGTMLPVVTDATATVATASAEAAPMATPTCVAADAPAKAATIPVDTTAAVPAAAALPVAVAPAALCAAAMAAACCVATAA
jgi:hypothetical protein